MQFHHIPERLASSPARLAVLRALLGSPDKAWTGSGLARAAGVTPRWAIRTLRQLEAEGAVVSREVPPSILWELRNGHLLVSLLGTVLQLDRMAKDRLVEELRELTRGLPIKAAILFGSAAAGREGPDSDLDLLVVVPTARAKGTVLPALIRRGFRATEKLGNVLAPIVLTAREFRVRAGGGFVRTATEEGVWIRGGKLSAR